MRVKVTSEQPFDHQREYMHAYTHTTSRERESENEDVKKVYTHVHVNTRTAGELQRTDNKEWINERTDEQMARPRTFSSRWSYMFYVH